MKRTALIAAAAFAFASSAWADLMMKSDSQAMGMNGSQVMYIKNGKMRTEHSMMKNRYSIMDPTTRQMIQVDTEKKTAEITDFAKIAQSIAPMIDAAQVKVSVTPNGETKTVAGVSCNGFDMVVAVPMKMGEMAMTIDMDGVVWVAKGAPGTADYEKFMKAFVDSGMLFGDPKTLKAMPGQAKGMTEMYKAMSALGGLTYASEIKMKFGGSPMAEMMNKMMGSGMTTTVTEVSISPLDDILFKIPAEFKTSTK